MAPPLPRPSGARLAHRRQARRPHLRRGREQGEVGARGRQGRPCRHARPRRHRPAGARLRRGDEDRPLRRRRAQGLPLHRALGRGHRDRRRRGRRHRHLRASRPAADAIRAALAGFTGDILQVPPQVSAVKVEGARAYDLARAGETLELAARPLHVERLELVAVPDPDTAVLEMTCGKGGYVRSIARDLGERLGCLGHVAALRRLWSGPFTLEGAVTWPEIEAGGRGARRPASPGRGGARRHPRARLPAARGRAPAQRQPGADAGAAGLAEGATAWASAAGVPLAIGTWRGGVLYPSRVLVLG